MAGKIDFLYHIRYKMRYQLYYNEGREFHYIYAAAVVKKSEPTMFTVSKSVPWTIGSGDVSKVVNYPLDNIGYIDGKIIAVGEQHELLNCIICDIICASPKIMPTPADIEVRAFYMSYRIDLFIKLAQRPFMFTFMTPDKLIIDHPLADSIMRIGRGNSTGMRIKSDLHSFWNTPEFPINGDVFSMDDYNAYIELFKMLCAANPL